MGGIEGTGGMLLTELIDPGDESRLDLLMGLQGMLPKGIGTITHCRDDSGDCS